MRSFSDTNGLVWQAAVGHESHGSMVILFSRLDSFEVLKSTLESNNRLDAENEIADLSVTELCSRLRTAQPWS